MMRPETIKHEKYNPQIIMIKIINQTNCPYFISKYCLSASFLIIYKFIQMSHKYSDSEHQKSDEDQIQITEQSSQELCFQNLMPEQKQQTQANYNKVQRLIQIAKSKTKSQQNNKFIQAPIYDEQERSRRISKNQRNKQKIKKQAEQRERSRQKKKTNTKDTKMPKQIFLISDQENFENQKYEMIQFDEDDKNKENQNLQNLILQIDQQMEEGEVKRLPQKFMELQKELDLQKWEQYEFAQCDLETRKAQKDQQRRQKRKTERLLEKKQKQAKIGKGKDRVSNSVFNGIEDYFM